MYNHIPVTHNFAAKDLGSITVDKAKVDKVVDGLMASGFKTFADIINYDFCKARNAVGQSVYDLAKQRRSRNFSIDRDGNISYDLSGESEVDYNLTSGGGILIDNFTTLIAKVIQEAYGMDADGKTALDKYFPDANYLAEKVVVEVFAAPGGTLDQYAYGTQVMEKDKVGNRSYEYEGIPYRNYMEIDERDLTFMRQLGNPDTSARGLLQRLTIYTMQAKVLVNNRKALLKTTIFSNGATFQNTAISYQIPSYNQITSFTDPVGKWGTFNTTTYQPVSINGNANPLDDIYIALKTYGPWVARAGLLADCDIIMSPMTEYFFLNNPNVRARINALLGKSGSAIDGRQQYQVETILKYFIPAFNGRVVVDTSAYLLSNSDVTWKSDGTGFTDTPVPQQYFIPPGSVLFGINTERFGGPLGEFIYTAAIQNGGMNNPGAGPWYIIEDLTAPGTTGGPLQPKIRLDFGMAGGLAPEHPEATFIGNFLNLVS
jgi:hypothetical protein